MSLWSGGGAVTNLEGLNDLENSGNLEDLESDSLYNPWSKHNKEQLVNLGE